MKNYFFKSCRGIAIGLLLIYYSTNIFAAGLTVNTSYTALSSTSYTFITVNSAGTLYIPVGVTLTVTANDVNIYGNLVIQGGGSLVINSGYNLNCSGSVGYIAMNGASSSYSSLTVTNGTINISSSSGLAINGYASINCGGDMNFSSPSKFTINSSGNLTCTLSNLGTYYDINMYNGTNFYINGGTLKYYGETIYVRPGAKMYVQNSAMIYMKYEANIDVQSDYTNMSSPLPGGILNVLSGSTIMGMSTTSLSPDSWWGIAVSGGNGQQAGPGSPPATYQYFSQTTNKPAKAIFDHATIAMSNNGISNYDHYGTTGGVSSNYYDWGGYATGGGIIQANYCTFINNNLAFDFETYQNYLQITNVKLNDASWISNCNFYLTSSGSLLYATTGPYYLPGLEALEFIYAEQVEGIKVLGCYFQDDEGLIYGSYPSFYPSAIYLTNAGMTIDEACNNYILFGCTSIGPSTFETMGDAIYADAGIGSSSVPLSAHHVNIYNTTFTVGDGSTIGITAVGLNNQGYANVKANTFSLWPNTSVSWENNNTVGIGLQGCTGYQVEGNTIDIYAPGNLIGSGFGIVANSSGTNANQIYRNNIQDQAYSIQANGQNNLSSNTAIGLQLLCNNMWRSWYTTNEYNISVNLFSSTNPATGIASFQQGAGSTASIHYSANNQFAPVYSGNGDINNTNGTAINHYYYSGSSDDPTQISGPVTPIPTSSANTCPNLFADPPFTWGPSMPAVNNNISTYSAALALATPGSGTYYSLLQSYQLAVDSMIRYYSDGFDSTYQRKGDSSNIVYSVDSVLQYVNDSTFAIIADTVMQYKIDSVLSGSDSVAYLLANTSYVFDYPIWLSGIYASTGDYSHAFATLSGLSSYYLDSYQKDQVTKITYILGLRDSLSLHGDSLSILSCQNKDSLRAWSDSADGYARYMARTFVCMFDSVRDTTDVFQYSGDDGGKHSLQTTTINAPGKVIISPNPVQDILRINMEGFDGSISVSISDILGWQLLMIALENNAENYVDMSGLKTGIYFARIMQGNSVLETQKILKQ